MPLITFINSYYDGDDEEDETLSAVQELQQKLVPAIPRPNTTSMAGGYFMNLIVKPNQNESEDSEECLIKKDSRELFALVRDSSATIQAARWPTECQVLDEKIAHISFIPPVPEPYYISSGREVQPKPVGEELGIIIYQYYPISAVNYFSRSSVGGSRFLLPTCPSPEEDSLRFESRFEGGNLAKAIKITATYYELYLRTDLYTNKHMQWFYFRITNMKKNIHYRFSIVNMMKNGSLFNEGMKPVLYSTKDAKLHHIGWRRCGDNITYFCNEPTETEDPDQISTYTLTFTLDFPHEGDLAYIAYSYPYTYTDLQDYLLDLAKHPIKSTYTTLRILCRTLAGNNLYYVTITAPLEPDDDTKKKAVIITARVHPGEAPASWMMKGVLDFLTGDSSPAKELREKFLFKIVPMLNPDGVIVGNSRCGLSGKDLNRQYRTVIRESYPAIWYTKLLIRRMVEECGVAMYVDLHAHSRKHNIFYYGCESRRAVERRLYEQVFPLMLHKNTPDKFSFEDCKFRVTRAKEGTGRVVMWMMGIRNSYTMEASFGGSLIGSRAETHFSTQDYEQMGRSFCETLLDFYDSDPRKERLRYKIIERLHQEGSNADEPTNIPLSDFSSDEGDTSNTSDEGRSYEFVTPSIVPPPSPDFHRKVTKIKTGGGSKGKTHISKTPAAVEIRKAYRVCKTTLDLSLPHIKSKYTSDSSSDAESVSAAVKKKSVRKRRAKKRSKKRQSQYIKVSDTDLQEKSPRSLSVMDLAPLNKFRSHSWHRQIIPPKPLLDLRNAKNTTQQLAEVQAKLTSLKNRLWFGSGEGDASIPLSWGQSKLSENKHKTKKSTRKQAKNESKNEKVEVKNEKKGKAKEELKGKQTKKKQECFKKYDKLIPMDPFNRTENFIRLTRQEKKHLEIEPIKESQDKSGGTKKKKSSKLHKKVTLMNNVNVFIGRD